MKKSKKIISVVIPIAILGIIFFILLQSQYAILYQPENKDELPIEEHDHPFDSEYIVDDETQRLLLYQGYKWYDDVGWIHPDDQYKFDNENVTSMDDYLEELELE